MADEAKEAYNWDEITGQTVERLRATKVEPVDEGIVKQAQRSWDGVPSKKDPSKLLHVLRHEFPDEDTAKFFARKVKKAGAHTKPRTSVSAVINPDPEGEFGPPTNDRVVAWRAGKPRGPKAD